MKKIFFFILLSTFVLGWSQTSTHPLKDKTILVVYGGWKGHQPSVFGEKIAEWFSSKGALVKVTQDTEIYTDKAYMETVDLVINHITMSSMSGNASRGLQQAVASGTGLAGCHGGLGDSFRENTEYQYMVGGQFVKHPGGQVDYTVTILDTNDPITEGISTFDLHTEQYYMHFDPSVTVLATTTFSGEHDSWIEGVVMPVAWKKTYGKGKVFYSAIGHSEDLFDIDEVWTLITRGATWAAR
jgi:type 1 glutamine amidotransferase